MHDSMDTTYNKLTSANFIKINKLWFRYLGVDTTNLLFELLDEEGYWIKEAKIDPEGWFFSTDENLQKTFPWSSPTIKSNLDKLVKLNLILIECRGIPRKRWIKINSSTLYWFANFVGLGNTELLEQCEKAIKDKSIKKVEHFTINGKEYC